MITKELIARINALSRKQRSVGLDEVERAEQQMLRQTYLESIREQVKGMLDSIEVVDAPKAATHVSQVEITLGQRPVLH